MINRRVVGIIGTSQLVMWGVSYYLIGILGPAIARELQWPQPWIYGGFSAALFAMGLVSPWAGWAIDRFGGSKAMAAGCMLFAAACVGLAGTSSVASYFFSWVAMGIAMRLTLYDAAFAALARRGGMRSRRAMSQVTLFGGLASTVFWPIGSFLESGLGWRATVLVYAVFGLAMAGMLLSLPPETSQREPKGEVGSAPAVAEQLTGRWVAAGLFSLTTALVAFINSGMSSHMIVMLTGLGLGLATAVSISALRGVAQTAGRLCELVFGSALHPLQMNVLAGFCIPAGFAALFFGELHIEAAVTFAILYGVGNGVSTITRGSVPLVLFGSARYGSLVGRLLVPSFVLSAAAPLVYAETAVRFGSRGTVYLSLAVAIGALVASICLIGVTRRDHQVTRES